MRWIKEANKIGKYKTTYEGFRIYIVKEGKISETIEEREDGVYKITEFIKPHLMAIDKTGLKLTGKGLEDIGYQIDKELLIRRYEKPNLIRGTKCKNI